MPISRIKLHSENNGKDLIFDLNIIQNGWVAQIIEGTFGETASYGFTDGNLTSAESSNININVRLTPVVTFTERTPDYILNFLGGMSRSGAVTLTDTDSPTFSIDYKVTGDTATAELSEKPASEWSQDCVIREIKYSYSEKPATIEFTITTIRPFLRGPIIDFYYGIRSTSTSESIKQFYKIFNRLEELDIYGDLEGLSLTVPKAAKDSTRTISFPNFPYKFFVKSVDPTKNSEVWLTKTNRGYKNFEFRGGTNNTMSYAYITEAYPMFSINKVKQLITTYGNTDNQISSYYGMVRAWVRFVQIKRGL